MKKVETSDITAHSPASLKSGSGGGIGGGKETDSVLGTGTGRENIDRKLSWDSEMTLDGFSDRRPVPFSKLFFHLKETSLLPSKSNSSPSV